MLDYVILICSISDEFNTLVSMVVKVVLYLNYFSINLKFSSLRGGFITPNVSGLFIQCFSMDPCQTKRLYVASTFDYILNFVDPVGEITCVVNLRVFSCIL